MSIQTIYQRCSDFIDCCLSDEQMSDLKILEHDHSAIFRKFLLIKNPKAEKYFTLSGLNAFGLIRKNFKLNPDLEPYPFIRKVWLLFKAVYNKECDESILRSATLFIKRHVRDSGPLDFSSLDRHVAQFFFKDPELSRDELCFHMEAELKAKSLKVNSIDLENCVSLWTRNRDLIFALVKIPMDRGDEIVTAFEALYAKDPTLSHECVTKEVASSLNLYIKEIQKAHKIWWYQGHTAFKLDCNQKRMPELSVASHALEWCYIEAYNQDHEQSIEKLRLQVTKLYKQKFPDIPLSKNILSLLLGQHVST